MNDVSGFVERYLRGEADAERLTLVAAGEGVWDVLVPSYWKEAVAVSLRAGSRALTAEAFFLRAPDDNAARAYHLLLQRNVRAGPWRFCANEEGDVSLTASIPVPAVTDEELDVLFGTLVSLTDETYRPYFELAFERALREQVERGGPGLDRPPPWAREGRIP